MVIKKFELTIIEKILVAQKILSLRQGFFLEFENDGIKSYGEVSPLPGLSKESLQEVLKSCRDLNLIKLGKIISLFLEDKENLNNFKKEFFLDYDFSQHTPYTSLQWGLCTLFSSYFRQKMDLSLNGKIFFQGLLQGDSQHILEKAKKLNFHFQFVKLKIGRIQNEKSVLKEILKKTNLQLRLDANCNFQTQELLELLKDVPRNRIDYIEEPLQNISNLNSLFQKILIPFALDENLLHFQGAHQCLKAIILKPTLIGDFFKIKKIIQKFPEQEVLISSSYESQVGLKNLIRLAYVINPNGHHGLDTDEIFLEKTATLEKRENTFTFDETDSLEGPIYVA